MFRLKIFSLMIVLLFVLGIATIGCAAGEKFRWCGVSLVSKAYQIEVSGEDRHMILIVEHKKVLP
jgi:hypothetical protein